MGGSGGKKIKKKHLNKASTDILVTEVGTHKTSQTTFLNNSANNGIFCFVSGRTENMIIDRGFQSAVPIYHSNNSEVILFKDILSKNENRKLRNYN